MIVSIEGHDRWKNKIAGLSRRATKIVAFGLAFTVPILLIVSILGSELTMMALSLSFFAIASIAAVIAWFIQSRQNSQTLSLWDVAGGFAITGCAASVLADPEHAVQLFEHLFERQSTSP